MWVTLRDRCLEVTLSLFMCSTSTFVWMVGGIVFSSWQGVMEPGDIGSMEACWFTGLYSVSIRDGGVSGDMGPKRSSMVGDAIHGVFSGRVTLLCSSCSV